MLTTLKLHQPVNITHPLVRDAYMKKDSSLKEHNSDVLVLEMTNDEHEADVSGFDSYLIDLLTDLEGLKGQAEERLGHIDRIDIITH